MNAIKSTYRCFALGIVLVALMSGCGKGSNSAQVTSTTPVQNTLTNGFNPNTNMFLNNNCPNCNFQNPATSCSGGIYTPNGTCITNSNIPGFSQNQNVLNQYSNAAYACGNNPMSDPYMMNNQYMTNNPYALQQPCQSFSNYGYQIDPFYSGGYNSGYTPYSGYNNYGYQYY